MKFDYIVIGGGSGGIASARRAAEFGAKVLLIEKDDLGGTCVNKGCVPKKVMWTAAQMAHEFQNMKHYGFNNLIKNDSSHLLNWPDLLKARDNYIQRLNGIYSKNLENSGVTKVTGTARFKSSNTIEVDGREYSSEKILIAVGGKPRLPNIPGAEFCHVSDDFFKWQAQPRRVCIVGSGYIGLEIAMVLKSLGTQVTLASRSPIPISNFDHDISERMVTHLKNMGIECFWQQQPEKVMQLQGHLAVKMGSQILEVDKVLYAIGREPLTSPLCLDATRVALSDTGHIKVDPYQNTTDPNIFAVGDVTGNVELTPVAINAGRKLAHRLFNNEPDSKTSYENIPSVVFTHPPIGTVGLSEKQANIRYKGEPISIYTSEFVNMYFSPLPAEQKEKTFMKLICVGKSQTVVGAHVIGRGADEMIQGFAVAVKMGATKKDFDETIAIHPTAAEEFVTMRHPK